MFFIAHWTHAVRTRVSIKSAASGTKHRHLAVISFLSHVPLLHTWRRLPPPDALPAAAGRRRWMGTGEAAKPLVAPAPPGFHLSDLLQMPNHRMVNFEFLGNFSHSCKRISFLVNFRWPVTALLIFKFLVSFAKLLELRLLCMFISSSWAKCFVDVVSCLHCSTTHFELK